MTKGNNIIVNTISCNALLISAQGLINVQFSAFMCHKLEHNTVGIFRFFAGKCFNQTVIK